MQPILLYPQPSALLDTVLTAAHKCRRVAYAGELFTHPTECCTSHKQLPRS